jgi:hypothetical protein
MKVNFIITLEHGKLTLLPTMSQTKFSRWLAKSSVQGKWKISRMTTLWVRGTEIWAWLLTIKKVYVSSSKIQLWLEKSLLSSARNDNNYPCFWVKFMRYNHVTMLCSGLIICSMFAYGFISLN